MEKHQYRGQTVLITVLVLTIALTVALSLIRRTTADVQTTGQLEESARAFSAAEAGIEDVLKRASGTTATIQSGNASATFDTTFTMTAGSSSPFTYPASIEQGDVATIWLVPHLADNSLDVSGVAPYCQVAGPCVIDICWDQPSVSPTVDPAVEVGVLYLDTINTVYGIERSAYDPDPIRVGNRFTRANGLGSACGLSNVYSTTVTLPTTKGRPLALRLRPYYNQTTFTVAPTFGRILPSQGFEVSSTGKTGSGVTRKIVVKKKYDAPSSIFDFVLYSNGVISNDAY